MEGGCDERMRESARKTVMMRRRKVKLERSHLYSLSEPVHTRRTLARAETTR